MKFSQNQQKMKKIVVIFILTSGFFAHSQQYIYLKPDRIFDGENISTNKGVLLKDNKIESVADYLTIEKCPPTPSIRIAVNRLLDDKDIEFAFKVLEKSSQKLL